MLVKMLVQTQYKNELLRENKTYDIPDETALRWDISGLAVIVEGQTENKLD
ncbi:hypothetical protein SAMN04488134_101162 [Amphibacillus marinus]|uniref:Uncharacterized protein n=1 Tax=Amphibacillus marinus TaxID=872970 RepID=A0A1H8GTK5_9BACI|nr:hypothetical protein [Amphibacillus marinus]SEN47119.1 hypothetical protein SAMN04488134_101162 [Amphibacillus marinus]